MLSEPAFMQEHLQHDQFQGRGWHSMATKERARGNRAVGVWSPFGQPFHPHGEVELTLGRKPISAQPPVVAAAPEAQAAAPTEEPVRQKLRPSTESRELPFPPVLRRGLGLGAGLHPERFPRELLRSSQQRVTSCQAGHDSMGLSQSDARQLARSTMRNRSAFIPSPASSMEEEPNDQALDEDEDEDASNFEPLPPLPLRAVLPSLPIGHRAAVEFKGVQRKSRLELQWALEERQRIRSSIFALPHARVGIGPLALQRRERPRVGIGARNIPSSLLGGDAQALRADADAVHQSAGLPASRSLAALKHTGQAAHGMPKSKSSAALVGGPPVAAGAAEHRGRAQNVRLKVERRGSVTGSVMLGGVVGNGVSAAGPSQVSRVSSSLVGRGGSFWHQATERITEQDGGVLQLWQAVLDKWECRKPLPFPSDAERATAIEMVQNLFDAIESLTTSRSMTGVPLTIQHVEELFQHCSIDMIDASGRLPKGMARELLLPLLRAAADVIGPFGAEELQRLQSEYAEPPKVMVEARTSFSQKRASVVAGTAAISPSLGVLGAGSRDSP